MKKIISLLLSLIMVTTFISCGDSKKETVTTAEKTFEEKIQELLYIADMKQYDADAEEKVRILYSEYKSLSNSKREALGDNQLFCDVIKGAELLTIAEVATALAIERIKSDLLRPSSFELVDQDITIRRSWPKTHNYESYFLNCDIKLIIDYSAQVKAGGFDRKEETIYFKLDYPCTSIFNLSQEDLKAKFVHEKYDIFFESNSGNEYFIVNGVLTK